MIEQLIDSGFPPEVIVFLISTLPVTELRGALPLAINLFHIPWYQALSPAIIGNLLPVPLLLLFLASLVKLVSRSNSGKRLVDWIFERTRRRANIVEKYGSIGLVLFVAIPLPGTGAWTGAVAAFLFGLRYRHALVAITSGVIISAAVVTSLSLIGWVGAAIAGAVLFGLAAVQLWKTWS